MDHVLGFGVRSVTKSIGVVSEVVAGRRGSGTASGPSTHPADSESHEDTLSREQDLDDIAEDEVGETENREEPRPDPRSAQEVASFFIQSHQSIVTVPQTRRPLPQPVILPQRRPKHRSRGFIRAYAPILNECSGIDQATFMDFLTDFDQAAKAWPIFNVINMAAFGLSMVPHATFIAASVALSVAAKTGEELQTRYKSNEFLDDINESFFKPRQLYALIMTYRPDLPDDALLHADITDPQAVALSKALDRDAGSSLKQKLSRFSRVSSGTTRHESLMPEPAPLIYPALDQALLQRSPNTTITDTAQSKSSSNALQPTGSPSKTTNSIVQDYLDRRAQAQFVGAHPDSKLASTLPPQQQKFVNRFSDPNHPVHSGSVIGLLTGGTWDPISSGRVHRAELKAKSKGEPPLTEEEKRDAYMGRKVRGRVTGTPSKDGFGLKKMFGGSVLYLVIANLPADGPEAQTEL